MIGRIIGRYTLEDVERMKMSQLNHTVEVCRREEGLRHPDEVEEVIEAGIEGRHDQECGVGVFPQGLHLNHELSEEILWLDTGALHKPYSAARERTPRKWTEVEADHDSLHPPLNSIDCTHGATLPWVMARPDRLQYLISFGYDGSLFYGVPNQPGFPTVGVALRARLEAAAGQRARALNFTARTDRGVHAVENLATCYFLPPMEASAFEAAVSELSLIHI